MTLVFPAFRCLDGIFNIFIKDVLNMSLLVALKYSSWPIHGSMHRRCSVKKYIFKNLANFTGKHLCLESLFNKVPGPKTCNFIEETSALLISYEICKILRTPI